MKKEVVKKIVNNIKTFVKPNSYFEYYDSELHPYRLELIKFLGFKISLYLSKYSTKFYNNTL